MKANKRYLIGLVILLALLGLLVLVLFRIGRINPNRHRRAIIGLVESRYNVKLDLGLILPIVYPGLGLEVKDIRVDLPDPDRIRPELIEIKSLKAILDLKELIKHKNIRFKEFVLVQPQVYYEWSPGEKERFKNIKNKSETLQPTPAQPERFFLSRPVIGFFKKRFRVKIVPEEILTSTLILISEGKFTVYDRGDRPQRIPPLEFGDVDIGINLISQTSRFVSSSESEAAGAENGGQGLSPQGKETLKQPELPLQDVSPYQQIPVRLSMPFPYQEPLGRLQPVLLSLQGQLHFDPKWTNITFHAEKASFGNNIFNQLDLKLIRGEKPPGFSGRANLQMNDLSQFNQILNWRLLPAKRVVQLMKFSGKGNLGIEFRYPVPEADAPGRLWYQGEARIANGWFDPGIVIAPVTGLAGKIRLSSDKISIPVYSAQLGQMPIRSDMVFSYKNGPVFDFHSTAAEIDLARFFPKRNRPGNWAVPAGSTLSPMKTVYNGDFQAQRLEYKKILCERAKGRWRHKNRVLGFNHLTLDYHQGWYQDNQTWVDFRKADTITFHFCGHFENFPLKRMMDEIFGYDFFVDGRATGEGYLSGTFVNKKLDQKSLNGYFKVNVTDGRLLGYNLGIAILQFLGFKLDAKKSGLDFEKGKAEIFIKKGVVYFDDLSIKSWNLEAHTAGKVDLAHQKVKLWVAVYPLEALSTLTRPIPLIGALINQTQEALFGSYAKAQGPWSDIKVSAYLPLTERISPAPKAPEFPARPWSWP